MGSGLQPQRLRQHGNGRYPGGADLAVRAEICNAGKLHALTAAIKNIVLEFFLHPAGGGVKVRAAFVLAHQPQERQAGDCLDRKKIDQPVLGVRKGSGATAAAVILAVCG